MAMNCFINWDIIFRDTYGRNFNKCGIVHRYCYVCVKAKVCVKLLAYKKLNLTADIEWREVFR